MLWWENNVFLRGNTAHANHNWKLHTPKMSTKHTARHTQMLIGDFSSIESWWDNPLSEVKGQWCLFYCQMNSIHYSVEAWRRDPHRCPCNKKLPHLCDIPEAFVPTKRLTSTTFACVQSFFCNGYVCGLRKHHFVKYCTNASLKLNLGAERKQEDSR